jgi:ABC-type multidrug transport system ATPase subunit
MRKTKRGIDALGLVTEALKSIHPGLERISILSVGGYLVPQFHMIEPSGKRHIFNVSQMSDGTLRVLGLLVALYQEPRPSVIALEEPEQTVNPAILAVIADAIKEVGKRSQILVTTHSPHLLDQFDPADIRSVELYDGKTVVGPVSRLQVEAVRDRLFSLGELLVSEGLHP